MDAQPFFLLFVTLIVPSFDAFLQDVFGALNFNYLEFPDNGRCVNFFLFANAGQAVVCPD
jgi:hypothetical protein